MPDNSEDLDPELTAAYERRAAELLAEFETINSDFQIPERRIKFIIESGGLMERQNEFNHWLIQKLAGLQLAVERLEKP